MIKRIIFRIQPPIQICKRSQRQKEIEKRHKEMKAHEPAFKEFLLKVLTGNWRG